MMRELDAFFDGKVLHTDLPLDLIPNTKVKIIIELPEMENNKSMSFLDTACSIKLEGPVDFSEKLEDYLYGGLIDDSKK
jgi:hypothetical protein